MAILVKLCRRCYGKCIGEAPAEEPLTPRQRAWVESLDPGRRDRFERLPGPRAFLLRVPSARAYALALADGPVSDPIVADELARCLGEPAGAPGPGPEIRSGCQGSRNGRCSS